MWGVIDRVIESPTLARGTSPAIYTARRLPGAQQMKPVDDGLHRMLQKYLGDGKKHTLHVWPGGQPDPRIGGLDDPGPRQLREAGIGSVLNAKGPQGQGWDWRAGTLLDVPPARPGDYRKLVQGGPRPFRLNAENIDKALPPPPTRASYLHTRGSAWQESKEATTLDYELPSDASALFELPARRPILP